MFLVKLCTTYEEEYLRKLSQGNYTKMIFISFNKLWLRHKVIILNDLNVLWGENEFGTKGSGLPFCITFFAAHTLSRVMTYNFGG